MEKDKNTEEDLVHKFDSKNANKTPWPKIGLVLLAMVVLGVGSGFLISIGTAKKVLNPSEINNSSQIAKGTALGTNDTNTFKDTAEGTLKAGGIDGEGQYHLERPGGETQFVYMTSSVIDLSLLKGRKVKVWGQTQKAQHAPWLMDVGRVEVLE